jgi:3-keto-L-gulonate-6-phosphate decarboxylase
MEGKIMMNRDYKIHRIKERGYEVIIVGSKITATKGNEVLAGSLNKVFKKIFGY